MKYDNLIIDCNNLFWRSVVQFVKNYMADSDPSDKEFYSVAIEKTLSKILNLKREFGNKEYTIYIIHDNPFSKINERQAISENYKHARKSKDIPHVFYKTLEKFLEILKVYDNNFYIIGLEGCEADDLVPHVLNEVKGYSLLISADLDWARSITKTTHWFNFVNVYTIETFIKDYGFNPSENRIKMYKTIHGDSSDNIENAVPYLPKEMLLHIVNKYQDIPHLFLNLWQDDFIPKQWKIKIKDSEIQLKINYQLVDFMDIEVPFWKMLYKCVEDIAALKSWFNLLDISFETRMLDKKNIANRFFEKKKSKRYWY